MGEKIIYLDSCIFVASFLKEEIKLEKIQKFFKDLRNTQTKFVTSDWTLTEIVKVLIKDKQIPSKRVADYIQELKRVKRIEGLKFQWIEVNNKQNYDFSEFFYEVQKLQLQYKGSLGDAIHGVIMKNNNIKTILTTDPEFDGMKGLIVINPMRL